MRRITFIQFILLIHYSGFGQLVFNNISSELGMQPFDVGENYGSGCTLVDIDGNGFLDLFVLANEHHPNRLYLNEGETWKSPIIIGEPSFLSRAAIWFDYNGDKRLDLFVLGDCLDSDNCYDSEAFQIFERQADGSFDDVSISSGIVRNEPIVTSLNGYNYSGGLAAGDLNLDGFVDLLITRWAGELFLFMNNGDGTFSEQSDKLSSNGVNTYFQPLIYDLNADHFQDILIAMDGDEPNLFFTNKFGYGFTEFATQSGLDHRGNDMGIAIGDYDNDLDYDLYISNIEFFTESSGNSFFENQHSEGRFSFTEIASSLDISKVGWGWGVTFMDANNDGLLDLAATNGWQNHMSYDNDRSRFWLGTGSGFVDMSQQFNFNDTLVATTLISGDIDRDGDLDLVQGLMEKDDQDQNIRVLRNDVSDPLLVGNYLVVKPRMAGKNHWAIGANIIIGTAEGQQMRPILAGSSFYGQEPMEAFFGLGSIEAIDYVKVIWPGGAETIVYDIPANQILTITDDDVLHAPSSFESRKIDDHSIELTWGHMSNFESHFVLQRSEDSLFTNPISYIVSKDQYSFVDNSLSYGVDYYYRIQAASGEMNSNWNRFILVNSVELEAAPTDFTSELITSQDVLLTWAENSETELGFKLQRSLDQGFGTFIEFVLPPNTNSYLDTDLEPQVKYYYRLYAFGTGGNSLDFAETEVFISLEVSSPLSTARYDQGIQVYPNPSKGILYIESTTPIKEVRCLDDLGRTIETVNKDLHNNLSLMRLSNVNHSMHIVVHLANGAKVVRRIIGFN